MPDTTYLQVLAESKLALLTVYQSAISLTLSNDQLIFCARSYEFQPIPLYSTHSCSQLHFHSIFYLFSLRLIYSTLDTQIYFLQFNFWASKTLACFQHFTCDGLTIFKNNFHQFPFFSKNHQLSTTCNFHLAYSDSNMLLRNWPSSFPS